MKRYLTLMLAIIFSLLACNFGHAQEKIQDFEKIYTDPEHVFIYPEGIFYLNEKGDLTPVRFVSYDDAGVYIVAAFYKCPACGRYNRDGICHNPSCPLNGK